MAAFIIAHAGNEAICSGREAVFAKPVVADGDGFPGRSGEAGGSVLAIEGGDGGAVGPAL